MKDAVFTWRSHFFMLVCVRPLCLDRLVGGHKEFHACPCNKICNGADAEAAQPTIELYGSGGNGGSGGGGGGGASNHYWWNDVYTTLIAVWSKEESNIPGQGGKGSAGTAGYKGCIIIYY